VARFAVAVSSGCEDFVICGNACRKVGARRGGSGRYGALWL